MAPSSKCYRTWVFPCVSGIVYYLPKVVAIEKPGLFDRSLPRELAGLNISEQGQHAERRLPPHRRGFSESLRWKTVVAGAPDGE